MPTNGNPQVKRTKPQRAADLVLLMQWAAKGLQQQEMADQLSKLRNYHVTQQTISRDMKEVVKIYHQMAGEELGAARGRVLASLEVRRREAFAAWERSKEAATKQTMTVDGVIDDAAGSKAKGRKGKKTNVTEAQCGDPAFLSRLHEIDQEIARLLGLYAAERMEHSGPNGEPISIYLPQKGSVISEPTGGLVAIALPEKGKTNVESH